MQRRAPSLGEPRPVSLDEVAFDETIVDMQDAAGDGIPDTGDDVEDARDEADVEKGDDEGNGQPEPNAGDETSLLGDLPVDESLTRELPGLGSAPVVDETIAMGDIPLPSAPSAHEAGVRHRKMSPKRRNLMVAGVVASRSSPAARAMRLGTDTSKSRRRSCRKRPYHDVGANWRTCRGTRLLHRLKDPRAGEWPGLRRLFCERNALR